MGHAPPKVLCMQLVTPWLRYYQLCHPFVMGSHLLPSQLPGEPTGHETASKHSEPIWNAHYSSPHPHCWYSLNLNTKGWRTGSMLQHRHQFSQVVTHTSTNQAHGCLTSVIDLELVKSCHFIQNPWTKETISQRNKDIAIHTMLQ